MADHALPCLCVFVKSPRLGGVKSRLAGQIGVRAALEAYITLVERELAALSDIELPVELWVEGSPHSRLVRAWSKRYALCVRQQPPGDLGRKMLEATRSCFDAGRPGMVIGSDLPEVDGAYVAAAASLLASHDVVLGPTEDGGYALIGLHEPFAALFTDIDWGTNRVYAQTRRRIGRLGLSAAELPLTWDVDTFADWQRFLRGPAGPNAS